MSRMRPAIAFAAAMLAGAAMPGEDGFDRALAALAAGTRAANGGDPARLRAAALALRASAARPVAGVDLAGLWLRRAGAASPAAERDRALGPGYRSLRLDGGGAARFEQTFLAGQRARVAVVPLGGSDFVARVSDDDRAPQCTASPRHALCDWVPTYTTRFTIEIANPGHRAGRYVVMMQ